MGDGGAVIGAEEDQELRRETTRGRQPQRGQVGELADGAIAWVTPPSFLRDVAGPVLRDSGAAGRVRNLNFQIKKEG